MTMRNTWSRWGMPLGVAPSPAKATLASASAQRNAEAAFFILIFLPGRKVSPRSHRATVIAFRRGSRRSGFYPAAGYEGVKGRSRCNESLKNDCHEGLGNCGIHNFTYKTNSAAEARISPATACAHTASATARSAPPASCCDTAPTRGPPAPAPRQLHRPESPPAESRTTFLPISSAFAPDLPTAAASFPSLRPCLLKCLRFRAQFPPATLPDEMATTPLPTATRTSAETRQSPPPRIRDCRRVRLPFPPSLPSCLRPPPELPARSKPGCSPSAFSPDAHHTCRTPHPPRAAPLPAESPHPSRFRSAPSRASRAAESLPAAAGSVPQSR